MSNSQKKFERYLVQAVGFLELGTAETLLRQQWEKERDPKASKHIVKAAALYHWGTLVGSLHHKIIKINSNKKLVVWITLSVSSSLFRSESIGKILQRCVSIQNAVMSYLASKNLKCNKIQTTIHINNNSIESLKLQNFILVPQWQ